MDRFVTRFEAAADRINPPEPETVAATLPTDDQPWYRRALKVFDGRHDNARKQTEGAHGLIQNPSQREIAAEAGLSKDLQIQAVRVPVNTKLRTTAGWGRWHSKHQTTLVR